MNRKLMADWSRVSCRDITSTGLLRTFSILLIMVAMLGCAPWSIERVMVNPAGPLGGINAINPVVLVAPSDGFQAVEIVVQFRRHDEFNGVIDTLIELDISPRLYPPGEIGERSVVRLGSAPSGSSRSAGVIFHAFCGRVEQANGPARWS